VKSLPKLCNIGQKLSFLGLCLVLTSSCNSDDAFLGLKKNDPIDPQLNLTRDDYRDMYDQKKDADAGIEPGKSHNVVEPPIPDLAEILAAPKPPKLGDTKLVSVAVTDDVPLKDVLIELARLADVDIEVDAGITGGISFRAKDRPFSEVIERISDMAGLRYTMKNNVLRVERDTPYVQTYALDFLNMDRSTDSSVNVSTSILSSSGSSGGGSSGGSSGGSTGGSSGSSGGSSGSSGSSSGGGSGLNSGSTADINMKSDSDFWKQFEASIKQILDYVPPNRLSAATISSQPPPPPPVAPAAAGDAAGALADGSAPVAPPVAAPAPVPLPPPAAAAAAAGDSKLPKYTINRQASTLTVSGTQMQHDMIKRFIAKVKTSSSSQVLIEAKVLEVTLNDEYQSGINWSQLGNKSLNLNGMAFSGPNPTSGQSPFNASNSATVTGISNGVFGTNIDLNLAVQLAQTFGITRTLSSPRLHALNNQQAVLSFAENVVYFTLTVTPPTTTTTGGVSQGSTLPTISATPHTVPIGVIMSVQPSIDMENNEVTLSVRPSLSKVVGEVPDPSVAFNLAEAQLDPQAFASNIPEVQVRELDSVLKIKSGQVMVIGGLMTDETDDTDQGLPGAAAVPWIGNLFKGVNKTRNNTELVIFIRATIVGATGDADKTDKKVYEKYTTDPRPLSF
jgi:MSHA biogenesis protein MshL